MFYCQMCGIRLRTMFVRNSSLCIAIRNLRTDYMANPVKKSSENYISDKPTRYNKSVINFTVRSIDE